MGAKKKQREAEHRAKKKAESASQKSADRSPVWGHYIPTEEDIGPVRDLLLVDVGGHIYDSVPGSFLLTAKGWEATSPLQSRVKVRHDVPGIRLLFEAILGLTRATGRAFELREDGLPWSRGKYRTVFCSPGDGRMDDKCEKKVETDLLAPSQFLLVDGFPEDVGRVSYERVGGALMVGAYVMNPCFYLVSLTKEPRPTVLA